MQVFIAFLILVTLLGGSKVGHHIRDRPVFLLALTVVVGISFYSLRVVL